MENSNNNAIELVSLTDTNENAFTVLLPKGWQNQAYLVRIEGIHRSVIHSRSPDGNVFLFVGDPHLPSFAEPTPDMYMGYPTATMNPMMQVQPFTHAEPFFLYYLQQRYGHAPGFRITSIAPVPELERKMNEEAQRRGMPVCPTSVRYVFEYIDGGRPMRVCLYGMTVSFGSIWIAEVSGILIPARYDIAPYDSLLLDIRNSYTSNPQWQQQQDHLHHQKMAQIQTNHQTGITQLQQNHQNNMQWIQNSAQQHQIRMDAIHAQGDARMHAWRAQQNTNDGMHRNFINTMNEQNTVGYGTSNGDGDFGHRRFLNYVTDQNTVVGPDDSTYQVDGDHERYYKHKYNDTYIGTDNYTERDDLRSRFGVNPDDYEEIKIRR